MIFVVPHDHKVLCFCKNILCIKNTRLISNLIERSIVGSYVQKMGITPTACSWFDLFFPGKAGVRHEASAEGRLDFIIQHNIQLIDLPDGLQGGFRHLPDVGPARC